MVVEYGSHVSPINRGQGMKSGTTFCRAAASPDHPAHRPRSDCVICLTDTISAAPLRVVQVIECLSYHKSEKLVDIFLLFAVANPSDEPQRLRIVHPGFVTASLRRFETTSDDARLSL